MNKKKKWIFRDPHFYWKIINALLALGILVLAGVALLGEKKDWCFPVLFLLGVLMCAFEGIMQFSKGRKVLGYVCSIFSGLMSVALIMSVVSLMW